MIDSSLITKNYTESRVLFADDLGSMERSLISIVFSKYGNVELAARRNQDNKIYGYLTFENHENAAKALAEMNYKLIGNRIVHLYWADEETKNLRYQRINTVMLMGLPADIDLRSLHQTLQDNFGEIINVHIPRTDKETVVAYVLFRKQESADELLRASPITINKKEVIVNPYTKSTNTVVTNEDTFTKVYFKNLPASMQDDNQKMAELIGPVAKVVETRFVGPQAAVVIVETHEQALNVIKELNGKNVEGSVIEVQRAQTKSEFNEKRGFNRNPYRGRGGYGGRGGGRGGFRGGYNRGVGRYNSSGAYQQPSYYPRQAPHTTGFNQPHAGDFVSKPQQPAEPPKKDQE